MSAALHALLAALLAQGADPAPAASPQEAGLEVELVSKPDEPELLDVVAWDAPAHEILRQIAEKCGRELRIDHGQAALLAQATIDVHLTRRPLRDAVEWIAGSAGLWGEVVRGSLRLHADDPADVAPEVALRRAIDGWRDSLLRDPLQVDAPRLRFRIGNALYQLGDFASAITVWKELEESARGRRNRRPAGDQSATPAVPGEEGEFGDMALVHFRCGHAYAAMGDDKGAEEQWLSIAKDFPASPLVAPARLETVKSLRRQGDPVTAALVLRLVVEGQGDLAPETLVMAAQLLNESGNFERAEAALELALRSTSDPALLARGHAAMARSKAGQGDWNGVVATAGLCAQEWNAGAEAAGMWLLLGEAHLHLDDPFTALLAVRRARELQPGDELTTAADLLEGRIWADCGLLARAQPHLERAGSSSWPLLAAPALELHSRLLREDGQLEAAARICEKRAALPGQQVAAAIELASIFLQQRNRTRCLAVVRDTLPHAEPAQREQLSAIAREALRDAPPDVAWPEFVGAPPPDAARPEEQRDGS